MRSPRYSSYAPYFAGTPSPPSTSYGYDDLDRVTNVSLPGGGTVTNTYESDDVYSAYVRTDEVIVDPVNPGRTATTERWLDARGNVAQTVDPAAQTTILGYDGQGHRSFVRIDGNAATDVVTQTDVGGRVVSVQDPDLGSVVLEYDALGRLRRRTHGPAGAEQAVEVTDYDTVDRIATREDYLGGSPTGTANWAYDSAPNGIGLPASVSQTDYVRTFQYDYLSRRSAATTTLTGLQGPQTFQYAYDAFGRESVLVYPNGLTARAQYNARGYQTQWVDGKGALLWQADAMDARGDVTSETLGNGLQTTRGYDAATGDLDTIQTGVSGSLQDLTYTYDSASNLVRRQTARGGQELVVETLGYDAGTRLRSADTTGLPGGTRSLSYDYDGLGNLVTKTGVSDVGGFSYGQNGGGIHAVSGVTLAGVTTSYGYDTRGNMTTSGSRTLGYAPFDKVTRIQDGTDLDTEIRYGPDRRRYYQRTDAGGRVTETAYYEGGTYEIVKEGSQIRTKAYVAGVLLQVGSSSTGSAGAGTRRLYLLRDSLGSVESATDGSGRLVARSAFAPFGARRGDDWADATPADRAALPDRTFATTTRGFTDHEHLDASQLIHMGGRVYDPGLGRFLSPDPVVVDPELSQGYNRYSYVLNNPLTRTDPTGLVPLGVEDGSGGFGQDPRGITLGGIGGTSVVTIGGGGSVRVNASDRETRTQRGFLNRSTETNTRASASRSQSRNPCPGCHFGSGFPNAGKESFVSDLQPTVLGPNVNCPGGCHFGSPSFPLRVADPATNFFAGYMVAVEAGLALLPVPGANEGLAIRGARFVDTDVLVAAFRGDEAALGLLRSGGDTLVTPNQFREFLAGGAGRRAFLQREGIQLFGGPQAGTVARSSSFQQTFGKILAGEKGRGDAALAAFSRETGIPAVTRDRRLFNFITQTLQDSSIPIEKLAR